MIIEYKGIKIDTSRPLKDYDIKLLEEIEKETMVKIPYEGKRIVDPKTGIVRRISRLPKPTVERRIVDPKTGIIRQVTEKLSQDDSVIEYKGIKIDISRPLTANEARLVDEIRTTAHVNIQYKDFDSSYEEDSVIEYKGIKIDISRPLTANDRKLLKQMEKEIKENESKYINNKNVRIVRRNGINWIYDESETSNTRTVRTNNGAHPPILLENKKVLEQLRKEGKVKKDDLGREMVWNGKAWIAFGIMDIHYENEYIQEENELSSQHDSLDNTEFEF